MDEKLLVDIEIRRFNNQAWEKRLLNYYLNFEDKSIEEILEKTFLKMETKMDSDEWNLLKRNFAEKCKKYLDDNMLEELYTKEICVYTSEEKNIIHETIEKIEDIINRESEVEIEISKTLESARKKHPIAAKIIAIILSGIIASMIDSSVQKAISMYAERRSNFDVQEDGAEMRVESTFINDNEIINIKLDD